MRKFIFILIILLLLFCSSCNQIKQIEKEPVEINFSNDGTVNGYRDKVSTLPDKIQSDDVQIGQVIDKNSIKYCGNKNSKKFHLSTCAYADKIKDENKVYFTNKNEYINKGYSPCKSCNP